MFDFFVFECEGVEILEVICYNCKICIGVLEGNYFEFLLCDVEEIDEFK